MSAIQGIHDLQGDRSAPLRKIIHVDQDAYFASLEQRDNPELRGKPVAVGGSRERGVVAAASYEARKYGVRSAMPSVTARRLCPDLIFVKPRFEVYREVSNQIREIFLEYTPLVEPLSLDEAYLDVTENLKGIPYATRVAKEIRARIFETTHLTASAGVSYCKFLAKMASDQNKPNGMFVITPDMGPDFVAKLPVGKFHGIGEKTAEKMNRMGIFSGADLRAQTLPFLQERFGKVGTHYYWISRGIDNRPVCPDRVRKSVGAENTFSVDLVELEDMKAEISPIVDQVWARCEKNEIRGRTVTLKVKFADFQQITRSRSMSEEIGNKDVILHLAEELLEGLFPMEKGVRLLGVTLSGLNTDTEDDEQEEDSPQLSLAL